MIRFFITRPPMVALMVALVVVTGVLSVFTMTVELWPPVEINMVEVATALPGASPEEVEDLVTIPIEDELEDLEDVDYVTSSSTQGLSSVTVVFEASLDERSMDEKTRDVQQRVNRVRDLPADATTPLVVKIATEAIPVLILSLTTPAGELKTKLLADELEDLLDQLPGVKSAWVTGLREREIAVEVDPGRLQAYGLSSRDVVAAIAAHHVDVPAGSVFVGSDERLIRVLGKPETLNGIERIAVRQTEAGTVYVGDVAAVRDSFKDAEVRAHFNGRPSALVMVAKEKEASTTRLVRRVDEVLKAFRTAHPAAVVETVFDSSVYVRHRMRELVVNGVQGFVLVVAILWFFLGPRQAMLAAWGIPFSFLATFTIMNLSGISLNFMTLYGVFIVLGILVDDAIVVAENITRWMEAGESPKRAALEGTRQVALPVTIAVTTTMVAFATMLLMKGVLGRFMGFLPKVVIIVLGCSLIEALLLLPTHVSEFVPSRSVAARAESRSGRWMRRMQDGLERVLARLLRRPWLSLAAPPTLLMLALLTAFATLRVEMFPDEEPDEIFITFELPAGSSLAATERVATQIERAVLDLQAPDIKLVYAAIGYMVEQEIGAGQRKNLGQVIVVLKDRKERRESGFATADLLRDTLTGRFAELTRLKVGVRESGPPQGKPVQVRVMGEDFAVLETVAAEIKAFLATQPGVIDIDDDRRLGNPEIRIRIEEERAAQAGVDFGQLAGTVRALFIGNTVVERRIDGKNVDVTVRAPRTLRDVETALAITTLPSPDGVPVPLSSLVTLEEGRQPVAVFRRDGTHVITVVAEIRRGPRGPETDGPRVNGMIRERFADAVARRYPGYRIEFGGEAEDLAESFGSLRIAFVAALLLIYALLVLQFNNLSHPLIIMMAVPLTLVGVMFGVALFRESFTLSHMIGIVALVGIGVNDAIVYIDYINHLRREEGWKREPALLQAARSRLRPILLTSITTIGGLMPMALRLGGGSAYLTPLARTIIYGLTTQTIFTILFIPVAYLAVDRAADWARERLWYRIAPRPDPRDEEL